MLFKIDEVLLLVNLTYLDGGAPLPNILEAESLTVGEMVNSIDLDAIDDDKEYLCFVTGFDWKNLIKAIKRNDSIMNTHIACSHFDQAFGGGGGVSAVFINHANNEAVVAFRGTAENEWTDDFVGGNTIDSLQQINALEWYRKVYAELELERFSITVAGHSKGGNKAKYIAILNDTPQRCVAFDGQGFSDRFMSFYRDRIVLRQDVIENHNIDFDYVNILLNDVGKKFYYIGYDYGKGGFAEAHSPNTFFNFKQNGDYTIKLNPNGQRPEMQILDQFMNSMVRSALSEKEKNETNEMVGMLVEKAFTIGKDVTVNDFMNYLCDLIGNPKYTDNAAYLVAYCIKYSRNVPGFFDSVKKVCSHFQMDAIIDSIDMIQNFVASKKFTAALNISNFLIMHVSSLVVQRIRSVAKKQYDVDLTSEQIKRILVVVSMTKEMLRDLEIEMDGSDIVVEDNESDTSLGIPENLNIVVLAGGLSNERNRSLATGYIVSEALRKNHNVILVDAFMGYKDEEEIIPDAFANTEKYSLRIEEIPNEIPDLWAVKKRRKDQSNSYFGPNVLQFCKQADLVFIALHGTNAENGKVQATFDILGVEYTGCDHFGSALSSNKNISKLVLTNSGIPVPNGVCIKKDKLDVDVKEYGLSYPVIVKPCNGGIGLGISVVNDGHAYKKALKEAFRWESEVIVEEYVSGREFSVSTLKGKALPVLEVLPMNTNDDSVGLTLDDKKKNRCPAEIDKSLESKLMSAAEKATKCLGLHAYSKADFIVRDDGTFVCLECDSLPELTEDSQIAASAKAAGMSFDELCDKIIEVNLEKWK